MPADPSKPNKNSKPGGFDDASIGVLSGDAMLASSDGWQFVSEPSSLLLTKVDRDCLSPRTDLKLAVGVADKELHGVAADSKLIGDGSWKVWTTMRVILSDMGEPPATTFITASSSSLRRIGL